MGFNSVYRVLQEVFPQVDSRMLRAVAIEHSKDADIAVEVVLLEVIPGLSEHSLTVSPLHLSEAVDGGNIGRLEATVDSVDVIQCLSEESTEAVPSFSDKSLPSGIEDAGSLDQFGGTMIVEPVTMGSLGPFHDSNGEFGSVCENDYSVNHDQGCARNEGQDVASLGQEEAAVQEDCETSNQLPVPIDLALTQLAGNPEMHLGITVESDPSGSSKAMSEKDAFETEMITPEDESTLYSIIARSDQICSTELLENIIEDARNNKKILVSAMDSVVNLMREVECQEKAAEQAKEAAARGCSDILVKVDELKQALLRAKEANDMHAGEVYAEKAILATEVKELQLRLFSLADEKNKSLGILDEMRKALEIRLAASLKEIETAEVEKLEKRQFSLEALAYQESQMEKVVEKSKLLKLEAEENSKLQEFLMDRGRVIDVLQGEMSVKCQDVKVLKEKFDKRISLGRSLSSSQTSSILASSNSSSRSFTVPSEPEPETLGTPKKNTELGDSYGFLEKSSTRSPENSIDDQFSSGEDKHKVVLDDGWELFENGDL